MPLGRASSLILAIFSILGNLSFPARAICEVGSEIKVVVTANRVETQLSQVGSSISVITAQQMQDRGVKTVADALRSEPGVDVVSGGPRGSNVAVFMRGANSEHTLVLIDGVEVNDPISPTRAFNFADLNVADIERIEVLRGPQSTLYGSDALGGVISIYTKRGAGEPSLGLELEGGSYDSFGEHISFGAGDKSFNYNFGASREDSKGISSAAFRSGNRERDGYENTSLTGKIAGEFSDLFGFGLSARYADSNADLDNQGGAGADDLNRVLEREQFSSRAEIRANLFDAVLSSTVGANFSFQTFEDNNDPDPIGGVAILRSSYSSKLIKFDIQNHIKIDPFWSLVAGAETEQEIGSSSYSSDGLFGPFENDFDQQIARTNSLFTQALFGVPESFSMSAGVRIDHHSRFGSKASWKLAPTYSFHSFGARLHGSIGTGFKAPSLFQLYSAYGNEDLAPEKVLGMDAGIEQTFLDGMGVFNLTYFWNKFDDLISFDPNTFISENVARAMTQGIESSLAFRINRLVTLNSAYTFTKSEDRDSGEALLRRPKNKISNSLLLKVNDRFRIDLSAITTGKRLDNDFSTFPAEMSWLGSYTLVHVTTSYQVNSHLELFSRIDNLFDRRYEEVLGYGEQGLAGFVGLRVQL